MVCDRKRKDASRTPSTSFGIALADDLAVGLAGVVVGLAGILHLVGFDELFVLALSQQAGTFFGRDVIDFNNNDSDACDTGHFFIALDVSRFIPIDIFKREIDRQLRDLRQSKRLPGVETIRLPGEQRAQRQDDRRRNGVPILDEVMTQLDKLATDVGAKKLTAR